MIKTILTAKDGYDENGWPNDWGDDENYIG